MKPISIKFKWILLLIFVVVFPLFAGTSLWMDATAKKVREMYPIEKSKNPAASAEFLKAMEYRIYIDELHPTTNYDHPVIKKLIGKMDEHFQKGKYLLPRESVEDIVWWVLFYKDIYGLVVPPRNDNSLAYESLPYQEFAKKHDEIFKMIERYPAGEVYFDLPEIRGFQFQAMAILTEFYYGRYTHRYSGISEKERAFQYADDNKSKQNLKQLLMHYERTKTKYMNNSKFLEQMKLHYISDVVFISTELIKLDMYRTPNHKLSDEQCFSEEARFIKTHTFFLLDSLQAENSQTQTIYKELFDKTYSNNPALFTHLAIKCPNLNPEMRDVAKRIILLEKSKLNNKKDKK